MARRASRRICVEATRLQESFSAQGYVVLLRFLADHEIVTLAASLLGESRLRML
jgi:hypothetical protein